MQAQEMLSNLSCDELNSVPVLARGFVVRLLEGESLEGLVQEVVQEFGESRWSVDVGYWADLARDSDVPLGVVSGMDEKWRTEFESQSRLFEQQQKDLWHDPLRSQARWLVQVRELQGVVTPSLSPRVRRIESFSLRSYGDPFQTEDGES